MTVSTEESVYAGKDETLDPIDTQCGERLSFEVVGLISALTSLIYIVPLHFMFDIALISEISYSDSTKVVDILS